MNAHVDPFKGLARYEKELQRNELYQSILQQLKSESYDASPIGHAFVNQYEQQLPGIITATTGDHSFLNSDEDTNRRVIMEAVSGGMALKAGLVAAILMIVFKIIRVMTNNSAFQGGGGGGGRGTMPYVQEKQAELVTTANELKTALKEAKESLTVIKGNALSRDETSPQYEAAEAVQSAYRVYAQEGDGAIVEVNKGSAPAKTEEDPFKAIEKMDLVAIGFGKIPAFMMVKDRKDFTNVIEIVNKVLKALNRYDPAKLLDMVEQVSSKLNQPKDSEFMLADRYNSMIGELVMRIGDALGWDTLEVNSVSRLTVKPELKDTYEKMIRTSYGQALDKPEIQLMGLEDFISDFAEEDGEFAARSKAIAEFNEAFATFLGANKELEESRYYSSLQHYSTQLTEYKAEIKQAGDLPNKDVVLKRLDMLISIIETYSKYLLAILCIFRKETDKVDTFREVNIDKMKKLAKSLTNFANSAKGEQT